MILNFLYLKSGANVQHFLKTTNYNIPFFIFYAISLQHTLSKHIGNLQ